MYAWEKNLYVYKNVVFLYRPVLNWYIANRLAKLYISNKNQHYQPLNFNFWKLSLFCSILSLKYCEIVELNFCKLVVYENNNL